MRVLLIVDHYPLSPRVKKVENMYQKMGYETRVLAWSRGGSLKSGLESNVDVFEQHLGYGKRLKKLLNMKKFKNKIDNTMELYHPNFVHAIDFEMAWLSSRLLSKYDFKMIYEVYDIKFFSFKPLNEIRKRLEKEVINRSSNIIFASPFFPDYYKENFKFDNNYLVLNNKPSVEQIKKLPVEDIEQDKKVISFIGTVRYYDILKNLIYATEDMDNIEVRIHGDGPDLEKIEQIKHKNVKTFGRFNIDELPNIYNKTDFVWACYPNDDENVKYAVSNKFFEALYFSKPIFVSNNTYLGSYVHNKNIGLAINSGSIQDIKESIQFAISKKFDLPTQHDPQFTWEYDEEKAIESWKREHEE